MPIIVRLDVMLAMRKMQLTTVAEQVGMTPQNLSIIKTGKARGIRFGTLEKLCAILDCQPGDLLVYEKDS